jgi:hypothetical protein
MGIFLETFYDVVRQGLPTIGAIGGLVWATADGTSRDRGKMVGRGLLGASAGWGLGYLARILVLRVVDSASPDALPNNVASLGPGTGNMGWTEPGTMPNPTQHPEPFANKPDLPKSQTLVGETKQTVKPVVLDTGVPTDQGEDIQVQGTLSSNAFGKI